MAPVREWRMHSKHTRATARGNVLSDPRCCASVTAPKLHALNIAIYLCTRVLGSHLSDRVNLTADPGSKHIEAGSPRAHKADSREL